MTKILQYVEIDKNNVWIYKQTSGWNLTCPRTSENDSSQTYCVMWRPVKFDVVRFNRKFVNLKYRLRGSDEVDLSWNLYIKHVKTIKN